VIGADAVSFAVLAASCWLVRPRPVETEVADAPPTTGGWGTILAHPRLLGLVAVTCVFFFLYGPVEVALPIHVAEGLHASAGVLGAYWAVFGVGAVVGSLAAGLVPRRSPWVVVVAIIIGWGTALLPVGLADTAVPGLIGFAAGGLIYGPFTAISTALFQRSSPPRVLSRVLATRTALTTPSAALGTLVGGPVVAAIGGRHTMLASGLLTIALGVVAAAVVLAARPRSRHPADRPNRSASIMDLGPSVRTIDV
jgi:predicted MFS family arabinose efflux permease